MTTPDFVPDWAKGIIWHQLFPRPFWNGGPGNDRRLEVAPLWGRNLLAA
jgi:hypothetical protein